jgi:hypothetical protein
MKTTLDNAIPTIIGNAVASISNAPHIGKYGAVLSVFHL